MVFLFRTIHNIFLSLLCYLPINFIPILFPKIPILSRFHGIPTHAYCVKVTDKKAGKKVSKTLKATVTVKNPTLSVKAASEVAVGATEKITATVKPASTKVTYTSIKELKG